MKARTDDLKVFFLLGSLADLAITQYGLEIGFSEINPIMSTVTPGTMGLIKLAGVAFLIGLAQILGNKYEYSVRRGLEIGSAITWIVVILNFVQVIAR